ncbi:hotdog fold thioesterase [Bacillus massiliglaciei]|uniref:hotdog fold thioesterase n=1 Tax=Bacillus massiliglaciei TaxID=1816693 RepID=UPI003898FD75
MVNRTLLDSLGIKITELEKGRVVGTMPVDERTWQPFGLLHGGASVALAETVASLGGFELIDQEKQACVGIEINANHLKGKRSGIVTAEANILHKGRTTMVWDIKIRDEQNRLISVSRCTLAVIDKPE